MNSIPIDPIATPGAMLVTCAAVAVIVLVASEVHHRWTNRRKK